MVLCLKRPPIKGSRPMQTVLSLVVGQSFRSAESLLFDLGTLRTATGNFSDAKKLGKGGFGPVYKGVLPHGQQITVKRLSGGSRQGLTVLRNEVALVAKFQHRNLVRLLGFCLEQEEKMVVYDYLPNTKPGQVLIWYYAWCMKLFFYLIYMGQIYAGLAKQGSHSAISGSDIVP